MVCDGIPPPDTFVGVLDRLGCHSFGILCGVLDSYAEEPAHRKKGGLPLGRFGEVVREHIHAVRSKLREQEGKKCVVS